MIDPASYPRHSQSELQAELDVLRSLRRRSISQPSDGIDPDLPPSPTRSISGSSGIGQGERRSPPTSPPFGALSLSSSPPSPPPGSTFGGLPAGGAFGGHPPQQRQYDATIAGGALAGPSRLGHGASQIGDPEDDPDTPLAGYGGAAIDGSAISDLFWLPARLHPEIAPQEFKNFIRDQTRPENLMRRSGSMLGRRKSTLSRQYIPSESDGITGEGGSASSSISRAPSRSGSFRRSTGLERLTLNDLQRLETLARQAAEEGQQGDESEAQLKRLVRRSMSLNPAALLSGE